MSVTQKYDASANKLVISISDAFNFSVNSAFRDAYRDIKPDRNLNVIVDLQRADYMDSSALGMLLLLAEHFKEQKISIINCSEYTRQVFDIANFTKKFNIS